MLLLMTICFLQLISVLSVTHSALLGDGGVQQLRDEDVKLLVFAPKSHRPGEQHLGVVLTIDNNDEDFSVSISDQDGEEVCTGLIRSSRPDPQLRCQFELPALRSGDNALHVSISEVKTNTVVLRTVSHFFYPFDTMAMVPWYTPLAEHRKALLSIGLLAAVRLAWRRYTAPLEVLGVQEAQPALCPPDCPPPPPALGHLTPLAIEAPPQAKLLSRTSTRAVFQPLRWLSYGVLLGAAALLGGPPQPIAIPTTPVPAPAAPAAVAPAATPDHAPPAPAHAQPTMVVMTVDQRRSAVGRLWRTVVMRLLQAVLMALDKISPGPGPNPPALQDHHHQDNRHHHR